MSKTELQKEFERLTPTARYITGNEYNLVYCAFLETRVEQLKADLQQKTEECGALIFKIQDYIEKVEQLKEEIEYLNTI